jgi:SAM-dependent methyltransferase
MKTKISPHDVMFAGDYDHYFAVGQSALLNIRCALLLSQSPPPNRILDLPCGHGRVLRALRAEYPGAEISACDIDPEGVEFCHKEFEAVPILGNEDCSKIALTGSYDLIWCGSLLTHINADPLHAFLRLFVDHLSPGGILVFTTHGRHAIQLHRTGTVKYFPGSATSFEEAIRQYEENGFGYRSYQGVPNFGISLARTTWITREIESFPTLNLLLVHEGGWDKHQDVFACTHRQLLAE